ncbi:hypothetical protein ACWC2T_43770 [Streptomyces sp. NPDC001393]
MPRVQRALDTSRAEHSFAAKLRELHDRGLARTDVSPDDLEINRIASRCGIGRATIYAALSGARLPSRRTLRSLVLAWDPRGVTALPEWLERLRDAQAEVQVEKMFDTPPAPGLRYARPEPSVAGESFAAFLRQLFHKAGDPPLSVVAAAPEVEVPDTRSLIYYRKGYRLPVEWRLAALLDALDVGESDRQLAFKLLAKAIDSYPTGQPHAERPIPRKRRGR